MSLEQPSTIESKKSTEKLEEEKDLKTGEELFFENFKSKFNLTKEDLEKNIDGFEKLTEGQQCLVLENLKQITLGRIQEEAMVKYKQNTAEAKFRSRIWQGISKKYQIAKLEKATAQDIQQGGIEVHKQTLQQLVNGMKEFGHEVKIQDGKLEIQYVSDFKNLTPEQQKQVDEFNQIATELSKIPYEWSLETANKKEQRQFKELKAKYDNTKKYILDLKLEELKIEKIKKMDRKIIEADVVGVIENEVKKNAMLYMNDVDMKVKLNQFLNSNPDVEKQLQNIKDKKVWLRALANVVTERGIYAGAGFLTRTATMSLIGLAGAPLAAAGMGGFLARKRGKETLKERSVLARKGIEDKSQETKDFVDAKYIHESIDFLITELGKEPLEAEKRDEMVRSLKFHIEDAKNKIEDGTVNYGGKENRLFNQYELIKKISEGAVQVEYNGINNEKYQKDIEVISEFLKKQDKTISNKQKKYLRDQMVRGAIMSAGFAIAGYAIRHFAEELGWLGEAKKAAEPYQIDYSKLDKDILREIENLSDDDKKYIAEHGLSDFTQKRTLAELEQVQVDKVAKAPPLVPEGEPAKVPPAKPDIDIAVEKPPVVPPVAEAVPAPKEAPMPIDIKIEGKIDTFSEAIYEATKKADSKTQDNFIHHVEKLLGKEPSAITDENRDELVRQTVRKLSVANIETRDDLDVKNLLHQGDVVRLKSTGNWEVIESSGIKAEAVSELQLRENWADIEGAKHGFTEEVSFAGDNKHLDMGSFNTKVDGVEVTVDDKGNFSGVVDDEKFSGNISEPEKGQTAKEVIEEKISEARKLGQEAGLREKRLTEFNEIKDKFNADSTLTMKQAQDRFGIDFSDNIQPGERAKLEFFISREPLMSIAEAKKIFELSEATGMDFNEPRFVHAYDIMPDDFKYNATDMIKAEGFMETFLNDDPKKIAVGLKKLGMEGEYDPKSSVPGRKVVIKDAFKEKGVNVSLTGEEVSVGEKRWYGGVKKIFKGKLSLDNLAEMKSRITGLPKEVVDSEHAGVGGKATEDISIRNTKDILKDYEVSKVKDMEKEIKK